MKNLEEYFGELISELIEKISNMLKTSNRKDFNHPICDVGVQSLSCVWLFVTPWTAARQASLSFTISWSLLKFISESVILSYPLPPSSPFAINHSQH